MSILFFGLAFLAGFLVVAGINMLLSDLIEDRRRQLHDKLLEETRLRQLERARNTMPIRATQGVSSESIGELDLGLGLYDKWRIFVAQTGAALNPLQVLLAVPVLAVVVGGLLGFVTGSLTIGLLVAVIAGSIPMVTVAYLRSKRRRKLLSQLPDAYEMLARVLKAGQTISQAMRGIADEFAPPISDEFAYCWEQQNLGLSPEAALRELAKRTGVLEVKVFVVALSIHRTTGGNLSQLLLKLSRVIRERERVRGKIEALTAEGKFQAYILVGLPFILAGILSLMNPGYLLPLLDYPIIFVITAVFLVTGYLWMQRIINFDH